MKTSGFSKHLGNVCLLAVFMNNILGIHTTKAKKTGGYNIFKLQLRESFLQLSCPAKRTCANHTGSEQKAFKIC